MSASAKPAVSVIVPVYNESEAVSATLAAISDTLGKNKIEHEIIAVNDGSSDGSENILNQTRLPHLKVIHHPLNKGYGASLKTGVKAAKHPWLVITDADGTYPVEKIPDILEHAGDYDMVIASRTGAKVHDTIFRKIGRKIVRRLASYVCEVKIEDINSGLRAFKKEDAERFWHLFPEGFSFTSTLTVASHSRGNRVKYVPIDYGKRAGSSSIKPAKDFIGFISLIARLAIYYRPLKVFVPASIALFVAAIAVLAGSMIFLPYVLDVTFAVLIIFSLQTLFFGFIADMIVKRFYSD